MKKYTVAVVFSVKRKSMTIFALNFNKFDQNL